MPSLFLMCSPLWIWSNWPPQHSFLLQLLCKHLVLRLSTLEGYSWRCARTTEVQLCSPLSPHWRCSIPSLLDACQPRLVSGWISPPSEDQLFHLHPLHNYPPWTWTHEALSQETPSHFHWTEWSWLCSIHASHSTVYTRGAQLHRWDLKGWVHCWTTLWMTQEEHPLPEETAVCSRTAYEHWSLAFTQWDHHLHCCGGFHDEGEVPGLSWVQCHMYIYS